MESLANQEKTISSSSYRIGQTAGFFRRVNNLIVEDREIESKA